MRNLEEYKADIKSHLKKYQTQEFTADNIAEAINTSKAGNTVFGSALVALQNERVVTMRNSRVPGRPPYFQYNVDRQRMQAASAFTNQRVAEDARITGMSGYIPTPAYSGHMLPPYTQAPGTTSNHQSSTGSSSSTTAQHHGGGGARTADRSR